MSILTRSTEAPTNVTRMADWRPRFERVKAGALGHPIAEIKTATQRLYLTEAAIECSLRDYAKQNGLSESERAASIACALRWFRGGSSAAKAISEGQKRARELAWGSVRPTTGPEVA